MWVFSVFLVYRVSKTEVAIEIVILGLESLFISYLSWQKRVAS